MPRSKLSSLLPRVETTIKYLTLTGLTDSSCTACKTREAQRIFNKLLIKIKVFFLIKVNHPLCLELPDK